MDKKSKTLFCISLLSVFATSCDPDIIDAFADGYRQGYYGTYYGSKASVPQTASDNETNNTEEFIELN